MPAIEVPESHSDETVALRILGSQDAWPYCQAYNEDPELAAALGMGADPDEASFERQIARAPGLREGGVRSSSRSSRPSLSRTSCSARSSSTRFSGITLGRRSASGSPLPRVLLHHDGDVADMSDMRTPARANAKYEGALPRSAAEMPTTLEMKK